MKIVLILSCVAAAMAGRLENVYLPPSGAGAAGGAPGAVRAPAQGGGGGGGGGFNRNTATILRLDSEQNDQGFHYAYETSDGSKAEQKGRVIPGATQDTGSLAVSGSYSYQGPDGKTYSVTYTADENGYRAEGAHLPTPPPIPDAILKSLQLTGGANQGYQGHQNSYDADSGYRY